MDIEQASVKDAREILSLQRLAYRGEAETYADFTIPPLTQTLERIRADFENQVFLKAVGKGRIFGSVRTYMREGTCFIGRPIVRPGFQNQGIGTKWMREVEQHFDQAGRYALFTGQRSERNLHLYQKLGYEPFRRERVSEALTLVFLEKRCCATQESLI